MTPLEARIGAATAGWVGASLRHPRSVVAVAVALTAGCLLYAASNLGLNADTEAMLSDELPFRQVSARLEALFPSPARTLLIVVDGAEPDETREAAEQLAERMRSRPDLYESVFLPGSGPFFESHGLLYLETDQLEELADRLAAAQPLLTAFSRDPTLERVALLLARLIDEAAAPGTDLPELGDEARELDARVAAVLEGRSDELDWDRWVLGAARTQRSTRQVVLVAPVLDFATLQPAAAPLADLAAASDELERGVRGIRVRVTGDPALSAEEMVLVSGQAARAGLVSFLLVAVLLLFALRSPYAVLSLLVTLVCGLIWTAAFAAFAIGHLNLVSVAFAVLFIGLGIDFGIHFCTRQHELLRGGRDTGAALVEAARRVGSSLVLCTLTTAIGFYAFLPTPYAGVAELGAISGTGMFLSLLATLTLLPALLALRPARPRGAAAPAVARRPRFPTRRPGAVLTVAMALFLLALPTLPLVRFNASPLDVRDPSAQSVQAMRDLLESSDSSPWPIELLAADAPSAAAVRARLEELPEVERSVSLSDFVPLEQDEKIEILTDVSLFLGALDGAPPRQVEVTDTLAALAELDASLDGFLEHETETTRRDGARELQSAARRTVARIERDRDDPRALVELEARLLGELRELVRWLSIALATGPITLDDLPNELRSRYVGPDGEVRVQVYPVADLGESDGLVAFVDAVRQIAPDASGSAVTIVESGRAIVGSLRWALGTAVAAIGLLLLVLWRNAIAAALVLIPLGFAALLTTAVSALFGPSFNFADVIVLPLLLGMGVDSGIHLTSRFRSAEDAGDVLRTSTARAVLFSALTTVASFGTLGLATHQGMASLGQLLTIGMLLTLAANMILLPALLVQWRRTSGPG